MSNTETASHVAERGNDVATRSEKPTWDKYYLGVADAASRRSSCERAKVGAAVVSHANRVVSLGYNDSPAGKPGCLTCPRRTSDVLPGSDYDSGPGRCISVHAEANALLYADRADLPGATLYVTREMCAGCRKLATAAGIRRVVTPDGEEWL